ncbi:MAG: glycosyltransferase family 39 protein [Planctomycetota bacterium]
MSESTSTVCPVPPSSRPIPDPAGRVLNGSTVVAANGEPTPHADSKAAASTRARWVWWTLGGITVAAVVLRFFNLANGGLWYDELIMARLTAGSWDALWTEIGLGRPPVYPVAGKLWADVFGHSDIALRSLSALLGVASVPVLFFIARRLFDGRVALLAAGLLAVSPYQIYYSQEHRYYALFLLLCLTSILLLLRVLGVGDSTTAGRQPRSRWLWVGYVLISALAFYTHTFTLFLLSSIGIAVLAMYKSRALSPGRMRQFLISQVAIMGLILPWGLLKLGVWQRVTTGTAADSSALVAPWISSPPWWAPVRTVGNFLFLGVKYLSEPWVIAALVVLVAGLGWGLVRGGGPRRWAGTSTQAVKEAWTPRRGAWWIAAAWAVGPLLMVLVLSYTVRPIYNDRYLMASTAGLYVLVAAGVVTLARVVPMWATVGVLLLGMTGSLMTYYQQPDKGAWAEAAAWLDDRLAGDEALAFSSERGIGRENANVRANWFWYAQRGGDQENVKINVRNDFTTVVGDLKRLADAHNGVWLVLWRDPDESIGLKDKFPAGVVEGLELSESKVFFDLTLLRFESRGQEIEVSAGRSTAGPTAETPNNGENRS